MQDSIEISHDFSSIQTRALSHRTFERKSKCEAETHFQVVQFYVENRLLLFL